MDFEKERLMMNEDEARERIGELLNESQAGLLTKYMFLEQKVEKQKEVIDEAVKYLNKYESIKAYYEYIDEDGYDEYNYDEDFKKKLLDILKEGKNE